LKHRKGGTKKAEKIKIKSVANVATLLYNRLVKR